MRSLPLFSVAQMSSLTLARDYATNALLKFSLQHLYLFLFTFTLGVGTVWYLHRQRSPSPTRTIISSPAMRPKSKGIVDTTSTEEGAWRRKMEKSMSSLRQLLGKSLSALSKNPYRPKNGLDRGTSFEGLMWDLKSMGFKDVETLLTMFISEAKGVQDDNRFLLENMIQLLSKLNPNEKMSRQLTAGFVNNLWDALPHPPLTTLDAKHKYRQADGSFNNILMPDMVSFSSSTFGNLPLISFFQGKAGTPYTRSAKSSVFQNIALPDPGVVFDNLMARGDKFEPHPNGISSMLFYFATLIVHDIFRTVSQSPLCKPLQRLTNFRIMQTLTSQPQAAILTSRRCMEAMMPSKQLFVLSRMVD